MSYFCVKPDRIDSCIGTLARIGSNIGGIYQEINHINVDAFLNGSYVGMVNDTLKKISDDIELQKNSADSLADTLRQISLCYKNTENNIIGETVFSVESPENGGIGSKDGENGLLYDNVYPDFKEENGEMSLVTSTSGSYENPVYVFTTIEDGRQKEVMLAFPHDKTEIGGLEFEFLDPVEYPGLRIKESPKLVNTLLLISFLIMTAGLYITFFLQPVMVCVDEEGYTVLGVRPDSMRYELKQVVNRNKEKKNA